MFSTGKRIVRFNPIVNFCSDKFLTCFAAVAPTRFIAGLIYFLRFERVDNWGAYSIPFGDQPSDPICLHPSKPETTLASPFTSALILRIDGPGIA